MKRFTWRIAAVVLLVCAAVAGGIYWQLHHSFDAVALVECLPQDRSTHTYIDVAALRRAGILDLLAGSKAAEDADYRQFVQQTGFDYRNDLDAVAAAFLDDNVYLAVRGRFAWTKLQNYAQAQGGHCRNSLCEMPASTPGRNISFYPLKPDVLAMAVSREPLAATTVGKQRWRNPPQLSAEPLWISAPAFVFRDVKSLPAGTHSFFSPLAQADRVVFTAGPAKSGDRLELRLDVACNSAQDAAALDQQFDHTTDLLRKMLEREHMTPNGADLSGVLVSGTFEQHDKHVIGRWPLERRFVEALFAGKIE
jgi:hypothetical protein